MVVPMPMIFTWPMPMVRFQCPRRSSPSEAVLPTHPIPSLNITAPTCSSCSTAVRPAYGSTHADDTLWPMPMVRFQSPSRCSLSEAVQPTHAIPPLNITPPTCSPCSTAVGPAYGSTHADDTPLADADGPLSIPQLIQSV